MDGAREADSAPQAAVWPPPPDVPFVEPLADPNQEKYLFARRYLNEAIFLFVGGCVFPFLCLLLPATIRLPSPLMFVIGSLHYLWPILHMVAAYFGMRAVLLARSAELSGLQVPCFIIIVLSVLFGFVSLSLVLT